MYKTLVLWASSRGPRVCKSVQVFMRVSIEGCMGFSECITSRVFLLQCRVRFVLKVLGVWGI